MNTTICLTFNLTWIYTSTLIETRIEVGDQHTTKRWISRVNFMLFLPGSKYNRQTNNILSCSNWFLPAFIFSDHWLNQFNGVLFTPALWIMSMTHAIFSSQRHCLSTDMREGTTPDFWWDFVENCREHIQHKYCGSWTSRHVSQKQLLLFIVLRASLLILIKFAQ